MYQLGSLIHKGHESIFFTEPVAAQEDIIIFSTQEIQVASSSGMSARRISLVANDIVLGSPEETSHTLEITATDHLSLYARHITLLGHLAFSGEYGHIICERLTIVLPQETDTVPYHFHHTLYRWLNESKSKTFITIPVKSPNSFEWIPSIVQMEGSDPEIRVVLSDTLPEIERETLS